MEFQLVFASACEHGRSTRLPNPNENLKMFYDPYTFLDALSQVFMVLKVLSNAFLCYLCPDTVLTLGNPGVLGLQFPEAFTTSCAGQGFLGVSVQQHLHYSRLGTTVLIYTFLFSALLNIAHAA